MQLSHFLPEREDAKFDALWALRFIGAGALQVGLLRLLVGTTGALPLILGGLITFGASNIRKFWLLFALTAAWSAFLVLDFVARRNPFSLIFAIPPLWHLLLLVLSLRPRPSEEKPA